MLRFSRCLSLLEESAARLFNDLGLGRGLQPALVGLENSDVGRVFDRTPQKSGGENGTFRKHQGMLAGGFERITELLAVPKKKVSKHRRGMRWSGKWLKPRKMAAICSTCGEVMLPHQIYRCCIKANEEQEEGTAFARPLPVLKWAAKIQHRKLVQERKDQEREEASNKDQDAEKAKS